MSGLYRTFKENYVPYFPDGRGRDRYIAYNNAGFFHDFPKSLSPSNTYKTGTFFGTKIFQHYKSPSVKAPNFHYHSDGNGRDKYILINGGGLFYDSKPLISYKLTDFLRKNDIQYHSPNQKRVALSRDELKYNKLLRNKEKELIKRLYINEKQKFMRKQKFDPLKWFSHDEIKNDDTIKKYKTNTFYLPNTNNNIKENEMNGYYTPRYKFENYKNENNNNTNNNLYKENDNEKLNNIKYKPKIFIDAQNNNKTNIISNVSVDNSCKTSNDFYNDIEKIKKYQTVQSKNKDLIKFKKQPYFHIINEHTIEKQNE
jgi:hypothetical protein